MFKEYSYKDPFILKYDSPYFINEHTLSTNPIGIPKQCYMNAFKLMETDNLTYVEGYCHTGILPIEHTWCVDSKGNVIDPTLKKR